MAYSDPRSRSIDGPSDVFSLTQIRHLMRVEFSRAQRYDYPVTCCVVACDGVDSLRDRYGYDLVERILAEVARLLMQHTRNCDYLGRLLDDRLMAILPHTDHAGAQVAAERVLAAARIPAFDVGGENLRITLSVGLSTYSKENTMFFDSLVQAAEDALSEAIEKGGDQLATREPGPRVVR